jgi:tungstate transport system substrate-binding protein
MRASKRPFAALLVALVALAALVAASAAQAATTVIVQGTTDVRDAGLLDDVIVPGFQAAYPQYTLKYIAVGTGQALTNAEAGQADAVLTHAPTVEPSFVAGGYSYEPQGRAIFYSDYVIIGPASDPAGVLSGAAHDAAHAFELIAAAGAAGRADFVSRGDASGTNVEEKIIWGLTAVPRNSAGEPLGTWYHKSLQGQALNVQVTSQCPFSSHACYTITDRGTFNRLVSLGTVTNLQVLAARNDPSARGGQNLLINSFHAYAVNPAKFPFVNLAGALAFLDYLTSPAFQARLASYPTTANPAFFADARPLVKNVVHPSPVTRGDGKLHFRGNIASALPGHAALSGAKISLIRITGTKLKTVGTSVLDDTDQYSFSIPAARTGGYRISVPAIQDMQSTTLDYGTAEVAAVVKRLDVRAGAEAKTASVSAKLAPTGDHVAARVVIEGRHDSSSAYTRIRKITIKNGTASLSTTIHVGSGPWQIRLVYSDPGVVRTETTRPVSVTVA